MKKTVFVSVCVLLLCGGLLCLHLTAQPERTSNPSPVVSLLEMNFDEVSERQLLEMKVDAYQKIAHHATVAYSRGVVTVMELAELQANLAAAEIELYRHTGEQDKLSAALQARVNAFTDRLREVNRGFNMGVIPSVELLGAEIELLDALLEQKRARAE